jgi:hypothetical protein
MKLTWRIFGPPMLMILVELSDFDELSRVTVAVSAQKID